jgi:hypothetical protein
VESNPVTTALATLDKGSNYVYTLSFLDPGNYTIAATCVADTDMPDTSDDITFVGRDLVSVTAGETLLYNFPQPNP